MTSQTKISSQTGHISDLRLKQTPVNAAKASSGNSGLEYYISRAQTRIIKGKNT
jgi:hypothetical protein